MSKAAIFALIAVGMMGCVTDEPSDILDPYRLRSGNGGLGTICNQWIQERGSRIETDSTATCKDGSAPRLYYAQWLSDNRACTITDPGDVKGGKIRRVFGCSPNPIQAIREN